MNIAILSDTHSRYQTVEKALALVQERKISTILHCGDIDDAETVWLFQGFTTHFVLGNCDTDRLALQQAIHGIGETLHQPYGQLELDGLRLAFLHGDDTRLLRDLARAARFDFLFHGHTHVAEERRVGTTRVVNPGALHRTRVKTFAVLDTTTRAIASVVVE